MAKFEIYFDEPMTRSRRLISTLTNLHDELSAFEIYFD
eukprot:CAMPEP_0172615614 /NCGR_PEP_ID=MMETSP1068-20121228/61302_1 /TAXON_ID=35684 /ORGANISM="Pseudopedinella elastica, Strain CCMP716" /LENGTH=37 /DNA_ID= /DNA_START= /DNA_END= /DNA_ORIENTATION=